MNVMKNPILTLPNCFFTTAATDSRNVILMSLNVSKLMRKILCLSVDTF